MTDNTFVHGHLRLFHLADAHTHAHERTTTGIMTAAGSVGGGAGGCFGTPQPSPLSLPLQPPFRYQHHPTPNPFRGPVRGRANALLPPEKSTTNRHKDTHSLADARSFAGDTPAPPTRGTPPHPRSGGHPRTPASCSVGLCYPSWGIGCYCRGARSPLTVAEWLWLLLAGGRVSRLGRPCGWPAFVYPPARGNSGAGLHGSAYGLRFTSALAPPL